MRACNVESDNPLTPLADAKQEVSLCGVWLREDGDTVGYLHIAGEGQKPLAQDADQPEPGLMRAWLITHKKDDNGTWRIEPSASFRFFVSELGNDKYLNIILPFENLAPRRTASRDQICDYEIPLNG